MQHLNAKQIDNRANYLSAHSKSVIKNDFPVKQEDGPLGISFTTPRVNALYIHYPQFQNNLHFLFFPFNFWRYEFIWYAKIW